MTEEKCYSIEKDGTFCLGFPNRHALTEKEIEEIFSDYGSVISVRTSGDERGFRFVRYRTLEEAESAVEGLKGHKKIRILPKKPKTQNANDKGSSKENQRNSQQKSSGFKKKGNQDKKKDDDDDFNDSFRTDEPSVTQSPNRKKPQPYSGSYNTAFKDQFGNTELQGNIIDADNANFLKFMRLRSMRGAVASNFGTDFTSNVGEDVGSKFAASKKVIQSNQDKERKNVDDFNDSFKADEPSISQSPNRQKPYQPNANLKGKGCSDVVEFLDKFTNGEDEKSLKKLRLHAMQLSANNCGSAEESVSKLQKNPVTTDLLNDKEPPELVSTDELKQRSLKGSVCSDEVMKTVLAEEVIVANVHEKFSVLYILYLLEKFEPISVSEMKTISKNGIRYCSVYFKTQKDAVAVEKQFDNFDLSGNKLIVRTPQLLVNEVAAA